MFVTLEGIEGSGKSTVIERLAQYMRKQNRPALVTREPGGSGLGKKLRRMLLDPCADKLSSEAELFLFLADRAQHVEELIRPALSKGAIVLCDRYSDSTLAYQGYGRDLDLDSLERLCALAGRNLEPDLTLLLDLPVRMGLERALQRNRQSGKGADESRFDAESLDFHSRVRKAYLALAAKNPDRIKVINAAAGLERVFQDCAAEIDAKLGGRY